MSFSSNLRFFFTYLLIFVFVSSWVVTVFWTDLIFKAKITKIESLWQNIFLDDKNLKSTYIFYTSYHDLSSYNLKSFCSISSKFSWKNWNKYAFKITYLDECFYWLTYLQSSDKSILSDSKISLKIFNKSKLFDFFVDRNNKSLNKINSNIENNIVNLKNNLAKNWWNSFLIDLQIKRRLLELKYQKNFLNSIIKSRKEKYISPVDGYDVSTKINEIPNADRPYRKEYTDWIHHWWDIMTPFWTPVIALSYWKIIRIVDGFVYSDLNKIKRNWKLTLEDQLNNLDILRWNQVWLKTSSWDVVFYSHLSEISEDIKVWDMVNKSSYLWKIWNSWVPEKNYDKFHLHFAIQKNPYLKNKIWKYSFMDYMKWDWYFKWKSLEYTKENTKNIFK